jgi:hypothetical protein
MDTDLAPLPDNDHEIIGILQKALIFLYIPSNKSNNQQVMFHYDAVLGLRSGWLSFFPLSCAFPLQ